MTDIASILDVLFTVLTIAIIGRAIVSWFDPMMRHGISQLLVQVTEPVIAPIRQLIPPIGGTLDISPIVALVLLQVVQRVVLNALTS